MAKLYVEYALSFGVESYEGLWKIQFLHPLDAGKKVQAWIPLDPDDELIGDTVDNIQVAQPAANLTEVMGWLYDKITRYPYYWPNEGTYVDKFGYDFEVEMTDNGDVMNIDITQIAHDILKEQLGVTAANPDPEKEVEPGTEVIEGGGALVKLLVTLDRVQPVSELNIAPFTKYPMELVSLMYEEDTETYHPKKEILVKENTATTTQFEQTTQSIRMQFPVVNAKRFTIILRQRNAEKNTYLVNADNVSKKDMWDKISQREAEVTLDTTDGLETVTTADVNSYSGWDIYLQQMEKYQSDLLAWKKSVQDYKQKMAEREKALADQATANQQYETALTAYRAEYNKAIAKYKTKVATYQAQLQDYNSAYAKYQQELTVYNKYLRDYSEWKSKWG